MTRRPDAATPRGTIVRRAVPLDAPVSWGCSAQGWNCCLDKTIPVRPYDVIRLRHAAGMPSHRLIEEGVVTLEWDGRGLLAGWLADRPYGEGQHACVFYEEVTHASARHMRQHDPERLRMLPLEVRRAAEATSGGDGRAEERVAGLCGAHTGRPEACRAFPFQAALDGASATQVFDCGPCALAERTTPRRVMLENGLDEYWRAGEAYGAVVAYLHALGLANLSNSAYRQLSLAPAARRALWTALYDPDAHPALAAVGRTEQWRAPLDIEGDRELLALVLRAALDAADRLIAASGIPPEQLGGPAAPPPRPDVDALLDPSRSVVADVE